MNKVVRILFFIPLIIYSTLNAQDEIRFKHLGMEDGLADKTVYCMLQDSHGYMWFGTGGGVCKYDGNTMISYLHINGDSTSLANDLVNCIYEDTTHTVWIGTHNGLSRYDPVKKNFSNYYFDKW